MSTLRYVLFLWSHWDYRVRNIGRHDYDRIIRFVSSDARLYTRGKCVDLFLCIQLEIVANG